MDEQEWYQHGYQQGFYDACIAIRAAIKLRVDSGQIYGALGDGWMEAYEMIGEDFLK